MVSALRFLDIPHLLLFGLILDFPGRIPSHFPYVSIWILKVSRVSSPERFLRGLDDVCSGFLSLRQYFIDFLFAISVVSYCEFCPAWILKRESCIVSNTLFRPKCELHAVC